MYNLLRMREVVIIDHEQFTKRRREIFLIEELRAKGVAVTVWDLSKFLFPDVHIVDALHTEYHKEIRSLSQLENSIKQCDISNTAFIVECFQNWSNRKIFKLLSDNGCQMIKIDFYANSVIAEPRKNKIKRLFTEDFFNTLRRKFMGYVYDVYKRVNVISDYRYILSSSELSNRTHNINHPDYDLFHKLKAVDSLAYKYAVFCDNYFPEHPDLKSLAKVDKLPDANEYRSSLNKFFTYIEDQYHLKVVIAAHPKSEYRGDEFEGRTIIKYKTNELIKHSEMVLLHSSNSISFAVLADKPIVFITNESYNSMKRNEIRIAALASLLGLSYYNIDRVVYSKISCSKLTPSARKDYIYTYLTSEQTEHMCNVDILFTFLSNLSNE